MNGQGISTWYTGVRLMSPHFQVFMKVYTNGGVLSPGGVYLVLGGVWSGEGGGPGVVV